MKVCSFPWILLAACVGPPAPDVEICRDVIARLCLAPVCETATTRLSLPASGCEATLLSRTGCAASDFAFTLPTRDRILECRLPLVSESAMRGSKPSCDFVDDALRKCPDLVQFLGGTP